MKSNKSSWISANKIFLNLWNTSEQLWSACLGPRSNLLICIKSFNLLKVSRRRGSLLSHLQISVQRSSEIKKPPLGVPPPPPVSEGCSRRQSCGLTQSPGWAALPWFLTSPGRGRFRGRSRHNPPVKGQPLSLASYHQAVMTCFQIFLFFKRRWKSRFFFLKWRWGKEGITGCFSQRDWEEYNNNNWDVLKTEEEIWKGNPAYLVWTCWVSGVQAAKETVRSLRLELWTRDADNREGSGYFVIWLPPPQASIPHRKGGKTLLNTPSRLFWGWRKHQVAVSFLRLP